MPTLTAPSDTPNGVSDENQFEADFDGLIAATTLLQEPRLARGYVYICYYGPTTIQDLIDQLDAQAVPLEEIQALVEGRYTQTGPESFDGVLYDQLHGEETAYKFYDDLIEAIEASDTDYALDREELLATLKAIREEEAEGVEEVTEIMEARE